MLRLPDDELSGDRDAVKGQGQAQGVPVTAGDVAAVMVGFMGWLNDVSSGDSSSSSSSNSGGASSSAGAGSNDSAREGNTVSKGSGLGPGLSLASTGKGVTISVREVLAWAAFVSQWMGVTVTAHDPSTVTPATNNQTLASSSSTSSSSSSSSSSPSFATTLYAGVLHGAHMVVLDGLGIGLTAPRETIRALKEAVTHPLCTPSNLPQQSANPINTSSNLFSQHTLSLAPSNVRP